MIEKIKDLESKSQNFHSCETVVISMVKKTKEEF